MDFGLIPSFPNSRVVEAPRFLLEREEEEEEDEEEEEPPEAGVRCS